MSEMIFNEQAFYKHLGGDVELGHEILRVYLVDAPERLQGLRQALDSGEVDLIVKYSHALKGISATVRAEETAVVSESIELAARKGDMEVVREYMPKVIAELDRALEAVRKHIAD
ncbi:Hpt domain-containing protein [Maridesulfovibrio sp.]|uniref:Hpt domain-containing protein n=1 Tax=Maridesulfovibrio sp. TaxID=2795000 RepID=UPI0029F4813B|nr:Hpt domain-containing protein [Maridesulfovibrio sp.]